MKHIGFTTEGNDLVEVSKEEYAELVRLHMAVEGKSGLPVFERGDFSRRIELDFKNTFQVIRVWYMQRMKVNELQDMLNEIRDALGK